MYRKITPNHPQWQQYLFHKAHGLFFCDAVTHNSPKGCSNPACWKYKNA